MFVPREGVKRVSEPIPMFMSKFMDDVINSACGMEGAQNHKKIRTYFMDDLQRCTKK